MVIAIDGDDAQAISYDSGHPDITLIIKCKAIGSTSQTQFLWSHDLFIAQGTIRPNAKANDAVHHRFRHIEILFSRIETNLIGEIDPVANDPDPLFVEQSDIAIRTWLSCCWPPVRLT